MRTQTLYVCEVCGTSYNSKIKCEQCEKSHKKPVKIVEANYVSFNNNTKGYPHSIRVEMDDNEVILYRR